MASNFSKKCEEYFGTRDFYEILKIDRNSTDKESKFISWSPSLTFLTVSISVKKAYHRLSLIVHPDRVDESKKLLATEKFKILGRIHSILQNSDKRKVYNECGEFDEESEISCSWQDYWKSIFKVITTEDIENFEKSYIGSETELQDLKRAYIYGKGDMDYIIQVVPFSNCASESRFIEIIRKLVDNGEVEEHDCFFNEPTRKRNRRIRKEEQDRKLFEEVGGLHQILFL